MKTLNQIRNEGFSALAKSLGPVDAIRFLRQFDLGHGDYTANRHRILGTPTAAEVMKQIKARRRGLAATRVTVVGRHVHHKVA
jgi:hypothetical protein